MQTIPTLPDGGAISTLFGVEARFHTALVGAASELRDQRLTELREATNDLAGTLLRTGLPAYDVALYFVRVLDAPGLRALPRERTAAVESLVCDTVSETLRRELVPPSALPLPAAGTVRAA